MGALARGRSQNTMFSRVAGQLSLPKMWRPSFRDGLEYRSKRYRTLKRINSQKWKISSTLGLLGKRKRSCPYLRLFVVLVLASRIQLDPWRLLFLLVPLALGSLS